MAINFEAANMAGYNNPKIVVLNAKVQGLETVVSAPKYADITNIFKSGRIPIINAVDADSGNHFVMWPTAIAPGGGYLFSTIYITPSTLTPMMSMLMFSGAASPAAFLVMHLQPATP